MLNTQVRQKYPKQFEIDYKKHEIIKWCQA